MEVRGAIVYATLIEVVAVAPVILLPGLSGSFFRPLATAYALAILASMAVALTVTPALCLILLRKAPLTRRQSPLVGWLVPRYRRLLVAIVAKPRRPFAARGADATAALLLPFLGSSLFPEFGESFLVHWISKPGTWLARSAPPRTSAGPCGRCRACATSAPISVRRSFCRGGGRGRPGRELGQRRPPGRLRPGPFADPGRGGQHPRTVAGRGDLPVRAHLRGAQRLQRTDHRPHLRRRPTHAAGQGRRGARRARRLPGITDAKVELQQDEPQIQITENLQAAQRYGLKPGDVRRAAGVLVAGGRGGRRHLQGRKNPTTCRSGAPRRPGPARTPSPSC